MSDQRDEQAVATYEADTSHLETLQDNDMALNWRWRRKDFKRGDKLYPASVIEALRAEVGELTDMAQELRRRVMSKESYVPPLEAFLGISRDELDRQDVEFFDKTETLQGLSKCHTAGIVRAMCIISLKAKERATAAEAALAEKASGKDEAYRQRNHLVAALARLFPSGIKRTDIEGWSDDWHGCCFIDLPSGQISYHYHDSHTHLFASLPPYTKEWDGHGKETVHERLAALAARPAEDGLAERLKQNAGLTAEMVEAHYPLTQHQPDECELCHEVFKIAAAALGRQA